MVKSLHVANALRAEGQSGIKRLPGLLTLLAVLGTGACAQLGGSQTARPPLKTSTVGAAAGAAVGAGLGAIIGSTTGDAGEGLVIGTVAGAATGMAIGYQMEKQEDARKVQEETITRQDAELKFQNTQLKELKQNLGDQSGNSPLSGQRSSLAAPVPEQQVRISSFNRPSGTKGEATMFRGESASTHQIASAQTRADEREFLRGEIKSKLAGSPVTVGIAHARPATFGTADASSSDSISGERISGSRNAAFTTTPALPPPVPASDDSIVLDQSQDITPQLQEHTVGSIGTGGLSGTGRALLPPGKAQQHLAGLNAAAAPTSGGGLPPAKVTPDADADEVPPAELPESDDSASAAVVGGKSISTFAPGPVARTTNHSASAAIIPARATAPLDLADAAPTTSAKSAKPAKLTAKGGTCKDAEAEAGRARTATSDADRLFYYRRALRLCGQEPVYHVELGKVYAAIGRKDDAQFEFNKALEADPENEAAQDELSLMMLDSTAAKNR